MSILYYLKTVSRRPVYQSVHLDGNFFFDGDCTSEETRRQIAENFVHVMETDLLYQREACPDNKTCNPDNVQVRDSNNVT